MKLQEHYCNLYIYIYIYIYIHILQEHCNFTRVASRFVFLSVRVSDAVNWHAVSHKRQKIEVMMLSFQTVIWINVLIQYIRTCMHTYTHIYKLTISVCVYIYIYIYIYHIHIYIYIYIYIYIPHTQTYHIPKVVLYFHTCRVTFCFFCLFVKVII